MGVVMHGDSLNVALGRANVEAVDLPPLRAILNQELDELEEYNCARYRLRRTDTARWIAFGRKR